MCLRPPQIRPKPKAAHFHPESLSVILSPPSCSPAFFRLSSLGAPCTHPPTHPQLPWGKPHASFEVQLFPSRQLEDRLSKAGQSPELHPRDLRANPSPVSSSPPLLAPRAGDVTLSHLCWPFQAPRPEELCFWKIVFLENVGPPFRLIAMPFLIR